MATNAKISWKNPVSTEEIPFDFQIFVKSLKFEGMTEALLNELPGTGVIEGVYDCEGQGTGESTASDVGSELADVRGVLGGLEQGFDGILEGEVQSLGGEITEDVSQVSLTKINIKIIRGKIFFISYQSCQF